MEEMAIVTTVNRPKGPIELNQRFLGRDDSYRSAWLDISRRYPIHELSSRQGHDADQVRTLYQHAVREKAWKYDPPEMVLNGIWAIPDYHVLVSLDGDKVAGTVRVVFLPDANFVFGSCLVIGQNYRRRGLAIPLILAEMSLEEDVSNQAGKTGIKGAVLGVDDDPNMLVFHSMWGVRFIDKRALPFFPPALESERREERIFGIRLESGASAISSDSLAKICSMQVL